MYAEEEMALIVDGDTYLLKDNPKISFEIDENFGSDWIMWIEQGESSVKEGFTVKNISSISFKEVTTIIDQTNLFTLIQYKMIDDRTIRIKNICEEYVLEVYGADGKQIQTEISRMGDDVELSLASVPAGIYIVRLPYHQVLKFRIK